MTAHERRIDRVLDPSYVEGLGSRADAELQAMRAECLEVEAELSYVRRLAQGRIDILKAERDRRASGGSIADLVAALPRILADEARPSPSNTRLTEILAPSPAIQWSRGLESLIGDSTLARLPDIDDQEVVDVLSRLQVLEEKVSATRRSLHEVVDAIKVELGGRVTSGH